jgi:hypothetical protein
LHPHERAVKCQKAERSFDCMAAVPLERDDEEAGRHSAQDDAGLSSVAEAAPRSLMLKLGGA